MVGSFKNKKNAQKYLNELIQQNYHAFIQKIQIPDKGLWHRICVGPFAARDEALVQKEILRSDGFSDIIVVGRKTETKSKSNSEKKQAPVKVKHEPVNNGSSPEKQLNFLIKRLFGVPDEEPDEFPIKGDVLKYLKTYTGQGAYGIDKDKLFPVDQAVSGIAKRNERKQILLAIRAELVRRGYRRRDLKKVAIRGLGDGVRVNNIFYETDIREALNEISEQTNISIIIDDTVQGTINIKFENTPLDEALKKLLLPGGFSFREMDGYYLVGFPQTGNPTFKHLSKTKLIRPVYMKPGEIANLLSDDYKPFIKVNDNNNIIVITSPPRYIKTYM